jgi:hypothetical protein
MKTLGGFLHALGCCDGRLGSPSFASTRFAWTICVFVRRRLPPRTGPAVFERVVQKRPVGDVEQPYEAVGVLLIERLPFSFAPDARGRSPPSIAREVRASAEGPPADR